MGEHCRGGGRLRVLQRQTVWEGADGAAEVDCAGGRYQSSGRLRALRMRWVFEGAAEADCV